MSVYTESFEGREGSGSNPSDIDIQQMMVEKAHELFKICDTEEKGFVTKRDMQRLQAELPLSPDQLESVFDSLDDDGNGYLTLEEFTDGFGSCFGFKPSTDTQEEGHEETDTFEQDQDHVEEELNFKAMMENLGATSMFDDESTIKALWCRLRKDDPEMSSNFEEFLYKISGEIRKSKVDFDTLESALKSKSSAHDEEVRKLYEEMEFQIKHEKERVLAEEKAKERQLREAMEADLYEKDRQLQELMAKHQEMEERMKRLNTTETETKLENEKLAREKEDLEESLYHSQRNLEESRSYINQIRQQQKDDKRERARAALKLSEGIAIERESLVKQLDLLRNVNKKLRDDKDEADTSLMRPIPVRRVQERESWKDRDQSLENISLQAEFQSCLPSLSPSRKM